MSFLINLREGLNAIVAKRRLLYSFEVQVNNWAAGPGDTDVPNYFGTCEVTPEFLMDFKRLCEKHRCGEKKTP